MTPVTAPSALTASAGLPRLETLEPVRGRVPVAPGAAPATGAPGAPVFESIIREVETRQATAAAATREVLLGQSDQLHRSVIARQEAALAFTLMVEVRNKVVESYQELMRLPV